MQRGHGCSSEHHHSTLQFVTTAQRHKREEEAILARRKQVYELSTTQQAERWFRNIRNWDAKCEAWLNLPKEIRAEDQIIFKAAESLDTTLFLTNAEWVIVQ